MEKLTKYEIQYGILIKIYKPITVYIDYDNVFNIKKSGQREKYIERADIHIFLQF